MSEKVSRWVSSYVKSPCPNAQCRDDIVLSIGAIWGKLSPTMSQRMCCLGKPHWKFKTGPKNIMPTPAKKNCFLCKQNFGPRPVGLAIEESISLLKYEIFCHWEKRMSLLLQCWRRWPASRMSRRWLDWRRMLKVGEFSSLWCKSVFDSILQILFSLLRLCRLFEKS